MRQKMIIKLGLALALMASGTVQASLTTYGGYGTWSSAVGAQTLTTIPDLAPGYYVNYGSGNESVTYSGVTFSTSSALGNGTFYNIGAGYFGNPQAVLSDQVASSGVENILITLPSAVTAFALNYGYGTFYGSAVTFTLGNGDTFTQASTGSAYSTVDFAGATDTSPFTTILVTSPDYVLNINNLVTANIGTPVPEPTTLISGALLLLPFGSSAVRQVRKKFQAA
jgi:hypothetical protein